jgi:transcriptional regulator with XRE-family HTH domain
MRATKPPANPLGAAVRKLRLSRGMTQAQLAEAVGIANETMSRIENSRLPTVSLSLATRLAGVLGVPVARLFEEPKSLEPGALRPGELALLTLVQSLSEDELRDLVRALRTLVQLSRTIGAPRATGPVEAAASGRSARRTRKAG